MEDGDVDGGLAYHIRQQQQQQQQGEQGSTWVESLQLQPGQPVADEELGEYEFTFGASSPLVLPALPKLENHGQHFATPAKVSHHQIPVAPPGHRSHGNASRSHMAPQADSLERSGGLSNGGSPPPGAPEGIHATAATPDSFYISPTSASASMALLTTPGTSTLEASSMLGASNASAPAAAASDSPVPPTGYELAPYSGRAQDPDIVRLQQQLQQMQAQLHLFQGVQPFQQPLGASPMSFTLPGAIEAAVDASDFRLHAACGYPGEGEVYGPGAYVEPRANASDIGSSAVVVEAASSSDGVGKFRLFAAICCIGIFFTSAAMCVAYIVQPPD